MRRMDLRSRRFGLPLALCLAPAVLIAQGDGAHLTATRTLLIDAATNDLSVVKALAVSPSGTIAIAQPQDNAIRLFDAMGNPVATLGRTGSGPGEFRGLFAVGWTGDTLWANDRAANRLTFFAATRQVLRTVPWPGRLTYAPPDPSVAGVGFSMVPWGVFPDGALLAKGLFSSAARRPAWAVGQKTSVVLKVRADGQFVRVIAWPPSLDRRCVVEVPLPKGISGGAVGIPFCPTPVDDVAQDGSRVVMVTFESANRSAGSFRVAVLGELGDTIFSRSVRFTPVPIPKAVADSAIETEVRHAMRPEFVPVIRDKVKVPSSYPPFRRVLIGRDRGIWIQVASAKSEARWLVIDPKGFSRGVVAFPVNFVLKVVEKETAWGVETDVDGLQSVSRYTIR